MYRAGARRRLRSPSERETRAPPRGARDPWNRRALPRHAVGRAVLERTVADCQASGETIEAARALNYLGLIGVLDTTTSSRIHTYRGDRACISPTSTSGAQRARLRGTLAARPGNLDRRGGLSGAPPRGSARVAVAAHEALVVLALVRGRRGDPGAPTRYNARTASASRRRSSSHRRSCSGRGGARVARGEPAGGRPRDRSRARERAPPRGSRGRRASVVLAQAGGPRGKRGIRPLRSVRGGRLGRLARGSRTVGTPWLSLRDGARALEERARRTALQTRPRRSPGAGRAPARNHDQPSAAGTRRAGRSTRPAAVHARKRAAD